MAKGKKDWLEPPDWWKKWKPLRWLFGALLLILVGSWVRALVLTHKPATAEPPAATTAPPATTAATEPAPAPTPTPAQEPVAAPTPSPADAGPSTAAVTPAEPAAPAPSRTEEPARPAPPTAGPAATEAAWEENAPEVADYTRVERDRLLIMDQFKSYDSVEAVQAQLAAQQLAGELRANHRRVHGDAPPFDLDTLFVPQFEHLGVSGKLTLTFFNDRLFEAEFEPSDAAAYLAALRRHLPYMRRGETGRSEYLEGHLRLASSLELAVSDVGRALHTRPYVLWQDRRLLRQRDEWDYLFAKYAG